LLAAWPLLQKTPFLRVIIVIETTTQRAHWHAKTLECK